MIFELDSLNREPKFKPLKGSLSGKCISLTAISKFVVACFSKFLMVLAADTQDVLAVEQLASIYACELVDEKTLAVACKAAGSHAIVTFSLESLTPTSMCVTPHACILLAIVRVG